MKNEKIVIALILGLAVLGYALITRQTKLEMIQEENRITTENELRQEELKATEESERKRKLSQCLADAELQHRSQWLRNCENFGSYLKRDDDGEIENCALPAYLRNDFDAKKQQEKDRCAELYK